MNKYGLAVLLIIFHLLSVMSMESTGPAFMWSPHIDMELVNNVNYQTLSSKDLARAVISEGSWSNIMCEGKRSQQAVDVAVIFVGKELQSSDISGQRISDASLVHLLKESFTKSNFSMAYPYVTAHGMEGTLENSLLEEFEESCDLKMGVGSIAVTDSCSIEDKQYSKLSDMQSVQEYVASSMEKGVKGQTNLLVVCHKSFTSLKNLDHPLPEGDVFSKLISSLDNSGAKYAVLYVSDSYNPIQHPSTYQLGRFLAEAPGNASLDSVFCNGVCQIKKSLLEALFVSSSSTLDNEKKKKKKKKMEMSSLTMTPTTTSSTNPICFIKNNHLKPSFSPTKSQNPWNKTSRLTSIKALKGSSTLSSNWEIAGTTISAPWLPKFEELDTTNMLLRQRIISQIDDTTADFVISQLLLLDAEDPKKDIKLFINSPGGSVTAGMGIYDAMKQCTADVSTICMGLAASVGAFLLASGSKGKRYCMPNSRVMIHQPLGTAGGKAMDMSIRIREMAYHKVKLNKILSRITGKPESQIELDTDRDNFMNPWEAKEYGLVDLVIDDGKPGLVAPIGDTAPPPKTKVWDQWNIEGSRKAKKNLPSENKMLQNDKEKEA